jgi:hypothetical protein
VGSPTINVALLNRVAALERRPGGTTAIRLADLLGIPRSTAGTYLARVRRGDVSHGTKKMRYVVYVSDPYLDNDFSDSAWSCKKRALGVAADLNGRYRRAFPGLPPLRIPLAYVVHEERRVVARRRGKLGAAC